MQEMIRLINFEFYDKELSIMRDIFVYQSFAGPSYAKLRALKQCHLVSGIDGKIWVEQNRRKSTSKEMLPLLPMDFFHLGVATNTNSHCRLLYLADSLIYSGIQSDQTDWLAHSSYITYY